MRRGQLFVWLLSPGVLVAGLLLVADAVGVAIAAGQRDWTPVRAQVVERTDFIERATEGDAMRRRVRVVLRYAHEGEERAWSIKVDAGSGIGRREKGQVVEVFVAADDPTVVDPDPPRVSTALKRGGVGLGLAVLGAWVFRRLRARRAR